MCMVIFMKKIGVLVSVLLVSSLLVIPVTAEVTLGLAQPSVNETTFAEMRRTSASGFSTRVMRSSEQSRVR